MFSFSSIRFTVNSTSGAIGISQPLDFDTTQSHTFIVIATDGGGFNARSDTATITVTILDLNDNFPTFQNLPNTVTVPENENGKRIFTIQVS